MPPAQRSATLAGLGAILLWSTLALLATLTRRLPPFEVLALCFGLSGAAGALRLACPKEAAGALRVPPAALALTTIGLFGYHALFLAALRQAPVVEANLVNYLWPLLVVLFAALLPGAKLRARQVAGALLGLAAAILLVTRGGAIGLRPEHAAGYLAALAAAVVWAGYSVLNRRFADVPGTVLVPACFATALLGGAAHALLETTVVPDATQWLALAAMGLGPLGAAFVLWDHGTKHGDLALLGGLSYLAPLLSTGLLLAFDRAQPHWTQAVAVALLALGAWLCVRGSAAG